MENKIKSNLIKHGIAGVIVAVFPWLFLFELLPISYAGISTTAEVLLYISISVFLFALCVLMKKDLKYLKGEGKTIEGHKGIQTFLKIIFFLTLLTLIVMLIILIVIGIAFMV